MPHITWDSPCESYSSSTRSDAEGNSEVLLVFQHYGNEMAKFCSLPPRLHITARMGHATETFPPFKIFMEGRITICLLQDLDSLKDALADFAFSALQTISEYETEWGKEKTKPVWKHSKNVLSSAPEQIQSSSTDFNNVSLYLS
ncbi:hypothetical protein UY3_07595 [Chelonia mydas]|uniref:Uncharacterized protein n=1 Tax=Chelonia mydas TaxID=8469 RepID=M7C445_CHEMY|nr:hypothetical protein UY3_07595 [Chelonia mydas]